MSTLTQRVRFRRDHRWTPGHLSAHLDGELTEHAHRRLLHHVRDCPECLAALRSLERMLHLMRGVSSMRTVETPDIATAVRRRMHEPAR